MLCQVYNCLYVGQSKTLKLRIDEHLQQGIKIFDAVSFIRCTADRLTKIEGHYIRQMVPRYNDCAIARKARERDAWRASKARSSGCAFSMPFRPGEEIKTIDAAECVIADRDLGEFFSVTDATAKEWADAGELPDRTIIGLLHFMASNSRKVSAAIEQFESL